MTNQQFLEIFERDLKKVKEEILSYKNEEDIWKINGSISNSAGTLCLHLIGNLNHFIGSVYGQTGYVRQRDLEFSQRNIPSSTLISELDNVFEIVRNTLSKLNDNTLESDYPLDFQGKRKTSQVFLILVAHLNYHLGQINFHRRLLS